MRKWSTQVSTVVVNVGRELSLLKMAINMANADYPSFFSWNELEPRYQQRAAGSLELANTETEDEFVPTANLGSFPGQVWRIGLPTDRSCDRDPVSWRARVDSGCYQFDRLTTLGTKEVNHFTPPPASPFFLLLGSSFLHLLHLQHQSSRILYAVWRLSRPSSSSSPIEK